MRPVLVATLLAFIALNAHAETFTVTLTGDPFPDGCLPGDCSLREAIEAAAANDPSESDVILVPAGTITLSPSRETLEVAQRVRVQGAGSNVTLIRSAQGATLFDVQDGSDLTLAGLGLESDFTGSTGASVSLDANAGSRTTLEDVLVLEGHIAGDSTATMTIRHSRLLDVLTDSGQLLVEDSTIANLVQTLNTSNVTMRRVVLDNSLDPDPSPGVYANVYILGGQLTLEDSTITHSSVYIDAAATLVLRRVHYVDNTGPIHTEDAALVTIEDSLFEDNSVRALYAAAGADWTVSGSSFVDNSVDGNAGGAILLEDDSVLRIRNSTFSGNTFASAAAAGGARGAAIGFRNGSGAHLVLTHVTIAPLPIMPAGIVGTAIGGNGNGVTLDLSNTIVRGSCGMNSGVLQNNAGNIESPGHSCGLDTEQNRVDASAADLALGTLGGHGGWTPTYLPAADSIAIDRASTPQCLPTDQRGYARPGGVRCDVGAIEADADDTLFTDGFEN